MAARKQRTPAEVKAAKQKKIAIVGSVLLVAILAFEVPKTLKMMSSKPPAASAAPATTATPDPTAAAPAPTDPAAATASAPAAASTSGIDGLVVNADLTPTPLGGQLPALTATFTSKDPFRQQLQSSLSTSVPESETTTPAGPTKPITGIVPGGGTGGGTTTTPTAPPTSSTPAAAPVSAVISVNGVQEAVGVASDFPAGAPLFTLKSLTKTTAHIAIAGGSLSSGAATITLKLNVPLTLMNTADGTRYKLLLVSTSSAAVAPATSTPAATPTTTTATTTTGG